MESLSSIDSTEAATKNIRVKQSVKEKIISLKQYPKEPLGDVVVRLLKQFEKTKEKPS